MLIQSSGESHQQDELSPVNKDEPERGIAPIGTSEHAGLKPLRLPQGKPALRKAPGPLTNEKRERALGYKISPTRKNDLWGTRKTKGVGEILRRKKRASG